MTATDQPPTAAMRATCRSKRRSVSGKHRKAAARRVGEALLDVIDSLPVGSIALYLPNDGELDPTQSVTQVRRRGWDVYLPVVESGTQLSFARWDSESKLATNRFGILEPTVLPTLRAEALDVVIVPCVAVDASGNRVGMGSGYYDRALARRPPSAERPLIVGVVFEVQVVDSVAKRDWDIPLDLVITEGRTIRPSVPRS